MSRIRVLKAHRAGRPVEHQSQPVKTKPCGCKDVEAIARESARIVEG
jgi:hypothetical protein